MDPHMIKRPIRTKTSINVQNLAMIGLYETLEIKHFEKLRWSEKLPDYLTFALKHWIIVSSPPAYELVFYNSSDRCWWFTHMIIDQVGILYPLPRRSGL